MLLRALSRRCARQHTLDALTATQWLPSHIKGAVAKPAVTQGNTANPRDYAPPHPNQFPGARLTGMHAVVRVGFRAFSAVAPGLAARFAARLWFRIPKSRIGETARDFLASGEQFTVAANGRRIVAWRWGRGRP